MLQQIPGYDFYQYGSGLTDSEDGRMKLRQFRHTGFREDLESLAAVVRNAGFDLVSESLQLGLQVLVRPAIGQTEQLSNALAIQELDIGARIDALSVDNLANWLNSLALESQSRISACLPRCGRSTGGLDSGRQPVRC